MEESSKGWMSAKNMIYVVLGIFLVTYSLLFFRKVKNHVLPIWVSMAIGAILMVSTFSISPVAAFNSIDLRVISFLFGMLVITQGFEKSGLIEYIVVALLKRARYLDRLLISIIFGSGFLSSLFVNDTLALLLTPIVLSVGSKIGVKSDKVLLIPLALGITAGSVISPIGNPQNLLVALNSGMQAPFTEFLLHLFVPSTLSMLAAYLICKLFYGNEYKEIKNHEVTTDELPSPSSAITDKKLALQSAMILGLLIVSFAVSELVPNLQTLGISIYTLAFAYGIILLFISPRRTYLIAGLNWGILIFFAGMFVVMASLWNSGIGNSLLSLFPTPESGNSVQSSGTIIIISVLLSQILSNVPFVQLYTFEMHSLGFGASRVVPWLALAAGSTIAGDLTILGAVSNVIIIEGAESRGRKAFTFFEFLKIGSIVTAVTALIFFVFLAFG